ncbi:MAG TPA: ArsI/CadI family heavy metal resistance metalloenzyme [Burkholderiaceae bacterium]
MKRLHVHVSVDNLAESIRFYAGMFGSAPSVLKDDYAKWMLDDPRVNFAISQRGAPAGLNHLGIQVESESELGEMQGRLDALQPGVEIEEGVACCYARSDKYWVNDPSGIAWETFHTLDSIPVWGAGNPAAQQAQTQSGSAGSACCAPAASPPVPVKRDAACCSPGASQAAGGKCC